MLTKRRCYPCGPFGARGIHKYVEQAYFGSPPCRRRPVSKWNTNLRFGSGRTAEKGERIGARDSIRLSLRRTITVRRKCDKRYFRLLSG
jgi:hypothetical protein